MNEATVRLDLPLIAPGQAQKELTHNEALAMLDLLVQPAVIAVGVDMPPADPAAGTCWVVGAAPTGAWAGRAGAIAGWTQGGWRFAPPREGMTVWVAGQDRTARYVAGAWEAGVVTGAALRLDGEQVVGARRPAITAPSGGTVVDAHARDAIGAILIALRQHGLIAS